MRVGDSPRLAVVVADRRAAGRIEDSEQAQLGIARVLDAVDLPARQVDAAAALDGRRLVAGPHPTASLKDAKHFFVLVIVVRRAPGRDGADELRDLRSADVVV